jgi:hypothetical protein
MPCAINRWCVSHSQFVLIQHAGGGSDSGIVEARRSSVNAQFHRGHSRSRSSDTHPNGIVKHAALSLIATSRPNTGNSTAAADIQRQSSAPSFADSTTDRPDNDFNAILDNLDQLTKQLDDTCSSTSNNNGTYAPSVLLH